MSNPTEGITEDQRRAEEALTQCQHIAYDGVLMLDSRLPLDLIPFREIGEYVKALEAKIERVANIAEAGEPDEDFREMLEADRLAEEIIPGVTVGDVERHGEQVIDEVRDRERRTAPLGSGAILTPEIQTRRGELAETGWPVEHMTADQILLAHEAEGDRNHERVSGERKVWEHEIAEAGAMSTSDGLGTGGNPLSRFTILCRPEGWTITFDALPFQTFRAPLSMSETEAIADATVKARAQL